MRDHILITCEHGGNRIPPRYRPLFAGFEALLQSHRGYDPGALAMARKFAAIAHGNRVIHLASHSFTPVLDGVVRNADIGLLYDPARPGEVELCRRWQAKLEARAPGLRVRRNYPYTGRSDGFTAWLRRRFPADRYVGIELEINQQQLASGRRHWLALQDLVAGTFPSDTMECPSDGMPAPPEIRSPLK